MENTNNIQFLSVSQEDTTESSFSFGSLFRRCLRNWLWFILSIAVCLGCASFYILTTRPVYNRSATVLIKEAAARRMTTSDIESVLSFSGGSAMSSKLVNEVIAFKSPALMQSVVSRLGLTTEYAYSGLFRSNVIYGAQVPVLVQFFDLPSNVSASLVVTKEGDALLVSKLQYRVMNEKVKPGNFTCAYGDTLDTGIGKIVITRNPIFSGEWKKSVVVSQRTLNGATSLFSSRLTAEPADVKNKSDVLNIVLSDNSVQRADDILNMLINIYNENWVEDKNKLSVSTSDFIADRLVALEKELGDVDNSISDYKSRHLLPDVNAVSELIMSQSKETARMMQELSNQLYMLRYIKSYLSSNPGTETLIPAAASIGSNAVATQINEYNTVLLQRNSIRSNSSEKNPIVQDMTQSLSAMRKVVEQSIDNQIGSVNDQVANLSMVAESTNDRIAQSPTQAKYLSSVGRQQKVKETLYLYLLQKREENELSQAFSAYNTRIITPPMGTSRPASPKKFSILLIALFLGFCFPLAVFYVLELTDTKVRKRQDLENLSLPFLGEVPYCVDSNHKWYKSIFGKNENNPRIVVQPGSRNIANEAFRVLRTNVEFMEKGNVCPVVVATSFNPGSGKTFVSVNESAALSIKGNRVLLIDADLRRASCSEYINSPRHGLSDYLAGIQTDVKSLIVKVPGFDTFDMLPVGSVPPNPSELVSLPVFGEMIQNLRNSYDYIILDCPPIDVVADTQIVSEYADRTVFIVRAGLFERKNVAALQKLYDDKRFKNLCYVFNGVDAVASYYGAYGAYGKKQSYYGKR